MKPEAFLILERVLIMGEMPARRSRQNHRLKEV